MAVNDLGKFSRDERFIIRGEFYIFFLLGVYTLMVGALVPEIRREYGISYELSGYLISANSIGMIAMNLIASYTAVLFGLKRAYVVQHALVIIGLIAVTISGNPVILLLGMTFIGFSRGSTANYSNQIINDITKSNSRYMNLVGVFFAFGACVAPFIMLLSSNNAGNWRLTNYGVSIAAAIGLLLTVRMKLGKEGISTGDVKRSDLSFFRRKKYWVKLLALFCYSGMEISLIGWISTYFIEAKNTTTQFASGMTTLLWVSILVGRIITSMIANRTTTSKLIFYLSIGLTVFTVLFFSNIGIPLQVSAVVAMGLFMSGIYSTILASAGPIFSEFKYAFGYFFMLSGLGPVITPTIIGIVAERYGVFTGVRIITVVAALLLVISFLNVRIDKKTDMDIVG